MTMTTMMTRTSATMSGSTSRRAVVVSKESSGEAGRSVAVSSARRTVSLRVISTALREAKGEGVQDLLSKLVVVAPVIAATILAPYGPSLAWGTSPDETGPSAAGRRLGPASGHSKSSPPGTLELPVAARVWSTGKGWRGESRSAASGSSGYVKSGRSLMVIVHTIREMETEVMTRTLVCIFGKE